MGTDGFHIGRHAARFFLQIGRQVPRLLLAGLVVAVATVVLVLILPPTADLLAARLGKVSDAFQKSTAGLIFVESPEVSQAQGGTELRRSRKGRVGSKNTGACQSLPPHHRNGNP